MTDKDIRGPIRQYPDLCRKSGSQIGAVQKYIGSCPDCQACKGSKASRPFALKLIVTGSRNELVQIDHVALSHTIDGYSGALVMIDHFTSFEKFAFFT